MARDAEIAASGKIVVFLTGALEGLEAVQSALAHHDDVELVGWAENVVEAADALTSLHIDVVVWATPGSTFPADDLASIREYTSAPVILLAPAAAPHLLEEALRADVADALLFPQPVESVVFAVHRVAERRGAVVPQGSGRVVTVFSPKGGTGKSVTAINLAAAFARCHELRTLLVDLDLQFGDCAIMLGLEPERTIYDLVTAPGELDAEKLAGYATRHPSGLELLAAPERPEEADLVPPGRISGLLEVARASYDVVVVDTPPFLHAPILVALDHTDDLLVIGALDVPALKGVRESLHTLELLSFPSERVSVVLNRATAKVGLRPSEAEAALRVPIRFSLPSDRAVPLAVNRGVPVVLAARKSKFARAVRDVASELVRGPTRARGRIARLALGRR